MVVGARDAAKGERAVRALRDRGVEAETLRIDVTDPTTVDAAKRHMERTYGRLDILVNNAGILPEATAGDQAEGPLDLHMFRETFETNVFGVVLVTQAFLPLLHASDGGRIVNVSTTMGSLGDQTDPLSPYYRLGVPAYRASKAALNSITIGLSKALSGTKVKVNSVCPGWVKTDLGGPKNRDAAPLTADEAARAAVEMALIGEDGPTGQFIDADGVVPW